MSNPKSNLAQELVGKLHEDEIFSAWKKNHPKSYLSHFFCQLSSEFNLLSNWELGYYDNADGKITVFNQLENENFAIKPADDVFKKEESKVEELDQINKITLGIKELKQIYDPKEEEFFPKEIIGNGFIILQKLDKKIMWNITFITHSVKFANIKINALNGEIISHDLINFVDKQFAPKKK